MTLTFTSHIAYILYPGTKTDSSICLQVEKMPFNFPRQLFVFVILEIHFFKIGKVRF